MTWLALAILLFVIVLADGDKPRYP